MIVVGDVHGKINKFFPLIQKYNEIYQVGDFGFKKEWDWLTELKEKGRLKEDQVKINMGNHDYMPYRTSHPNSLGDYSYDPSKKLFTVRGADSVDKSYRTEGKDWWREEELTYLEGINAYNFYEEVKPEILITHDCPQRIMEGFTPYRDKSITRQLLQQMFEIHQPTLWLFGHHHRSIDFMAEGTNFICLNELETYEI